MNRIINMVYLGNVNEAINHAEEFDLIICMMDIHEMDKFERQDYLAAKRPQIIYTSCFRTLIKVDEYGNEVVRDVWVDQNAMDVAAANIDWCVRNARKVLVHCAGAEERSPLTIMWYLNQYKNIPIHVALNFVKKKHSPTKDRLAWLRKCKIRESKGGQDDRWFMEQLESE